MIKTNILLAYRSLMKEKGFTIINTIGLALGLACFILIMVYVMHERSYEQFWPNHNRIYRVYQHGNLSGGLPDRNQGFLPFVMAEYVATNYPEVEKLVTLDQYGGAVITYKDNSFQEWRSMIADSNYFDVFPAEFIVGNSKTALVGSHKVVLTESSARKWFGNEDPMGKLLKYGSDSVLFEVTGVVKDPRTDTHVKYSMLLSDQSITFHNRESWLQTDRYRYIYVQLKEGASEKEFEAKLQSIFKDKFEPEVQLLAGKSLKEFLGGKPMPTFRLQKLDDIHLDSLLTMEVGGVSGNKTMVNVAGMIAFAILFLACINFINLSTARFSNRMKEICVKKTVGSSKAALFVQFMSESYLLTFISIIIALAMVELTIKPFCDSMQLEYIISFYKIPYFFLFIGVVFLLVGLLSGAYPAIVMSNTGIINGLRGKYASGRKGAHLRKALVVVQFMISFIILLSAIVVHQQLGFIFSDNKGYSRQNLTVLHNLPDIKEQNQKAFKEQLEKLKGIESVSFSNIYPTFAVGYINLWNENDATKNAIPYVYSTVDADFVKAMKLTIMKGRDFDRNNPNDSTCVLINEVAAKKLGYTNPVGKRLGHLTTRTENHEEYLTIIGVVNDFNILTVHKQIEPMVISIKFGQYQEVLVRSDGNDSEGQMKQINRLWKEYSNGNNLATESMDDIVSWLYRNETSASTLVSSFSLICILIASLGLIGLVSYSSLRRTKEIGIRKANGAQVWQIVFTLSKDTILLIAIAIIIALPLSIWAINRWLGQFAYHIDISLGMIVIAIIGLYVIALISEIVITTKAARQNPVKALRYE